MFRNLIFLGLVAILVSCGGETEDKGPAPLNPTQKKELYLVLADVADLVGSHVMIGIREKSHPIKLSQRAEQIRTNLEIYGCRFSTRQSTTDYPIGKEVVENTEMIGNRCPTFRIQRNNIIVNRSEENRYQTGVSGKTELLFKPNDGMMKQLEFQSSYSAGQVSASQGGLKTYQATAGAGIISYGSLKYTFKMENDLRRNSGKAGINQRSSRWEFNMVNYIAVIDQDGGTCRLNGAGLSTTECATMIENLREVLDSPYFKN